MKTFCIAFILLFFLSGLSTAQDQQEMVDSSPHVAMPTSYLAMFEIPASDIDRAVTFYETIFGITIERMEIPEMQMGILPYENQVVNAVIIQGEGYEPGPKGVTVYFNAGTDLQVALDKVKSAGGQVLMPKTAHADGSGFFALILDSEGNKLGLNSVE